MATPKKASPSKGQVAQKKAAPKKVAATKTVSKPVAKEAAKPAKTSTAEVQKTPNAIFNIAEINELLKSVNQSNVNELKLEKGDFKITIRQGLPAVHTVAHAAPAVHATHAPAPVAVHAPAAPAPPAPAADNLITIKSPMIGTFYRSAGPGKPTFVNVGDEIKEGQVICIVEAMKLFN